MKISTPDELVKSLKEYKPNDKVDISYKRNGKEIKTAAILGEGKSMAFRFHNGDLNLLMPPEGNPNMENFKI